MSLSATGDGDLDDDVDEGIDDGGGLLFGGAQKNSDYNEFGGKQPAEGTQENLQSQGNWIPHKIMAQWRNGDGVRQLTILVALTGGTACSSTEGIDVAIQQDGHELVISEEWTDYMKDINSFYKHYQNQHDTLELDDHYARRLAMKDALRTLNLQNGGVVNSVHRCPLPFRVDSSEVDFSIHGDKYGGRYIHIDLAERSKIKIRKVNIMEETNNEYVPSSAKKVAKYAGLHLKRSPNW